MHVYEHDAKWVPYIWKTIDQNVNNFHLKVILPKAPTSKTDKTPDSIVRERGSGR